MPDILSINVSEDVECKRCGNIDSLTFKLESFGVQCDIEVVCSKCSNKFIATAIFNMSVYTE